MSDLDPPNALYCNTEALTRMAREGNLEVLERLESCYGDCLRAVGRAKCASCTDAEDAVQEAFANAAHHLDGFEGRGSLRGWMNVLVANACHRMRRGARNTPERHIPLSPEHLTHSDPEQELATRHHAKRAFEALQLLPEEQREFFCLAAIEGWTAPELAKHFGCTPGAVRARLKRIRRRLRDQLTTR